MKNPLRWIKRQARKIQKGIRARRHMNRLQQKCDGNSKEHEDYLESQLRRSLEKSSSGTPDRCRRLIDEAASHIDLRETDVLCVGCRSTTEIDHFLRRGAKSVVGIDLFSERDDILVMDMHAMEFESNRFDLVFSSHSLEHSLEPQRVIGEITRVVKPGGLVAIEVPAQYETRGADLVDFESLDLLHGRFGSALSEVLWSEAAEPKSESNSSDTVVLRTVFRVAKSDPTHAVSP